MKNVSAINREIFGKATINAIRVFFNKAPLQNAVGRCDDEERTRVFLIIQLIIGSIALLALPIWMTLSSNIPNAMIAIFLWLLGPFIAVGSLILSRSIDFGFVVSAVCISGLVATISIMTGGISSFALFWLIIIPLEAALSTRRRVVFASATPAIAAFLFVYLKEPVDVLFTVSPELGFLLGPVSALLVSTFYTMRIQTAYRNTMIVLEDKEQSYRLLSDNATDLITRHDIDGKIIFASPSAKSVCGILPDQMLQDGEFVSAYGSDKTIIDQMLANVLETGRADTAEFRLNVKHNRRKSDSVKSNETSAKNTRSSILWMEMRARPIWDENQTLQGCIAITRDITQRRIIESQVNDARIEAETLSSAKGQFLANMSHELRTPLNAIIGFSDIIEQEYYGKLETDKQREYIKLIKESGSHLLQVVTGILDMSKIESGTFEIVVEPFDVRALINTCCGILSQQSDSASVTIKQLIPKDFPEAVADSRSIRQILINLIANAIKFSEPGSTVTVGVRLEGKNIVYFVTDTGIGISEDDVKRLGSPFFQASSSYDRRYEGTGLGLSVVKGLAELHMGRIEFESQLGEGTTVTVYMPLDYEDAVLENRIMQDPGKALKSFREDVCLPAIQKQEEEKTTVLSKSA